MKYFIHRHLSSHTISSRIRRVGFVSTLLLLCVLVPSVKVSAYSQSDFNSIYNGSPFYDPTDSSCAEDSATATGTSLPSNIPASYQALLTQAATHAGASVTLLGGIFLTENGNVWKSFPADKTADASWATSNTGAEGPFQFEPGTWSSYATDGNGDGKKDVDNMWDSAYSAAEMLAAGGAIGTTQLSTSAVQVLGGKLDNATSVLVPHTLLWVAASYNAGEGAVEEAKGRVYNLPEQTIQYVDNVYALISSGFTKGDHPNYPPAPVDDTGSSSTTSTGTTGTGGVEDTASNTNAGCGDTGGQGIIATALSLAWPVQYSDADRLGLLCSSKKPPSNCENRQSALTPTDAYVAALNKIFPDARTTNASLLNNGADCGLFVSTVLHDSGADTKYPEYGTAVQYTYVKQHPELYTVYTSLAGSSSTGISNTSQLQPGDILILNGTGGDGHTVIYLGPQSSTPLDYDDASASQGERMPNLGLVNWTIQNGLQDTDGRGPYIIARPKTSINV
jgi:hypothetical protein